MPHAVDVGWRTMTAITRYGAGDAAVDATINTSAGMPPSSIRSNLIRNRVYLISISRLIGDDYQEIEDNVYLC